MTTSHITLYGIPNCHTVKKSRAWFAQQGLDADFHDFKKQGVPADHLRGWMQALGWQKLVNRQGTTWRKLEPAAQAAVQDGASAALPLQEHPSVVKRPVVEWRQGSTTHVSVGFVPDQWLAWRGDGAKG